VGEIRNKCRFKCIESFQLFDPSDFGYLFASVYTKGNKFQYFQLHVTEAEMYFRRNPAFRFKQLRADAS